MCIGDVKLVLNVGVAIVGLVVALVLVSREMIAPAIIAALIGGAAVVASTKPAVSAVLATLGLIGGLTTFVLVPSAQNALMSIPMKLLSTLLFMIFYTVLMDGIVLLICVFYNLFAGLFGLGGLSLDLEDDAVEAGE
jgi:hypothetical protein